MKLARILHLVLMLSCAPMLFAQGVFVRDSVTTSATNVQAGSQAPVYTVPYAQVKICTATFCTALVPIYQDAALTQALAQPVIADAQGKFSFYVAPGSYFEQVTTPGGSVLGTYPLSPGAGTATAASVAVAQTQAYTALTTATSALAAANNAVTLASAGGGSGVTPTFTAGTATLVASGSSPSVSLSGTAPNYVLNVSIPAGATGAAGATPTIAGGNVTSLASGATPTAALRSTGTNTYALDLGLPAGTTGAAGATGSAGPAPTLTMATPTALANGSAPTATITPNGTGAYTVTLGIPAGPAGATGASPTIAGGNVTQLASTATPTATVRSTGTNAYAIDLGIPAGPTGTTGATGATGAAGATPTIAGGNVTSLAAGASPTAALRSTGTNAYALDIGVPAGATGAAGSNATNPNFTASATTLAAGSSATVTVSGTYPNLSLTVGVPQGPSGTATAAGTTANNLTPVQLGSTSNQLAADADIVAAPDHSMIALGPRINVRDPLFATGWTLGSTTVASCANTGTPNNASGLADPTDTYDSTCAIQSAEKYVIAWALAHVGMGLPTLYVPSGTYLVYSANYTSAITLTYPIYMMGDGSSASVIDNSTSPYADALFWNGASGNCNASGSCVSGPHELKILGGGHTTVGGGVEVANTQSFSMFHTIINNVGGTSLNLQGSTERSVFRDSEIDAANVAVRTSQNSNELTFDRVNVMFSGQDAGNWCYSRIHCSGGALLAPNATTPPNWYSDPTALVNLWGDTVDWMDSSVKGLVVMSAIRVIGSSANTKIGPRNYFEGFPTSPAINHAVEVIGPSEIGHLTAAITAAATTIPVDDAVYQQNYINDPAYATSGYAVAWSYRIVPSDYLAGSTAASTATGIPSGTTRGTYENVSVIAFSADQAAHLAARAMNSTTAIAWPAGSLIVAIPSSNYGSTTLEQNHINTDDGNSVANINTVCSDTAQLPSTSNVLTEICGDVIAGPVPDGIVNPFPNVTYDPVSADVVMDHNSVYFGPSETLGTGWVKVPGNATVHFYGGGALGNAPYSATAIASGAYSSGSNLINFVNWGTANAPTFALGEVGDATTNVDFVPGDGYFQGDYLKFNNGSFFRATQVISPSSKCTESWSPSVTSSGGVVTGGIPTSRTCNYATGFTMDYNSSGTTTPTWVNVLTSTSSGLTTNGPLLPVAGITNSINSYVNASTYTIPVGQRYTHIAAPSGGGTYTLPTVPAGTIVGLVVYGPNPFTIVSPVGTVNLNTVNYGATAVFPGTDAKFDLMFDGSNWHNSSYVPEIGSLTATTGAGAGGSVTVTLAAGSTVHAGTMSFTTTAAGTAAATALTFAWPKAVFDLPKDCHLSPKSVTDANVMADYFVTLTGAAGAWTGWTVTTGATGWPVGSYTFAYSCAF